MCWMYRKKKHCFLALGLAAMIAFTTVGCGDEAATIAFRDWTLDRADLLPETVEWLEWYNSLSEEGQRSVSFVPPELCAFLFDPDGSDAAVPEMQEVEAGIAWANWTDDPKVQGAALNRDQLEAETGGPGQRQHLPVYRCDTAEELEQFRTDFEDVFDMDRDYDEVPGFEEAAAGFDKDFFEENTLLMVYVEAISCTFRFDAAAAVREGALCCVQVEQTNDPECYDEGMAGWLLLVPLDKDWVQGCTEFDAVMV